MRISGFGIAVDLPTGWEGTIYRRPHGRPILHAGDFALPPNDADFGTTAIEAMGPAGAFAVLAEYDPALAGQGLFSRVDTPWPVRPDAPHPRALQRLLPGRAGLQRFFTASDRAFCLYLVIGTASGPDGPVHRANRVLATVRIEPRSDFGSGSA